QRVNQAQTERNSETAKHPRGKTNVLHHDTPLAERGGAIRRENRQRTEQAPSGSSSVAGWARNCEGYFRKSEILSSPPAALQRHRGEGGAVLLVIVVERVIPPGAVLGLQPQHERGEVVLVLGTVGHGQLVDEQAGVIVAEVEEIAGHGEERLMRD